MSDTDARSELEEKLASIQREFGSYYEIDVGIRYPRKEGIESSVKSILQAVDRYVGERELTVLDQLADLCMYLAPKTEAWDKCHELINVHLEIYQKLKFGKTSKEVNAEYWLKNQSK
jgi:hypothetical protein